MTKNSKLKIEILQKLEVFSMAKLKRVLAFVTKLDSDSERRKRLLSYAGTWKEIDQELFDDLTNHLHTNRSKDIRSL